MKVTEGYSKGLGTLINTARERIEGAWSHVVFFNPHLICSLCVMLSTQQPRNNPLVISLNGNFTKVVQGPGLCATAGCPGSHFLPPAYGVRLWKFPSSRCGS